MLFILKNQVKATFYTLLFTNLTNMAIKRDTKPQICRVVSRCVLVSLLYVTFKTAYISSICGTAPNVRTEREADSGETEKYEVVIPAER